jgi:DNA-binding XRE family transcriptional regulator
MNRPHALVQQLQCLREQSGMTRYAATRQAGLGEGAIYGWETGRYGPTVHGLQQYARLFGLRVELVPDVPEEQVGEAA